MMATAELDYRIGEIRPPSQVVYHCHIALVREDDGYCAIVLNLPGASSDGATEEEAMQNVRESICGLIESYNSTNHPIPWKDPIPQNIPEGARTKWILVNV